MAKKNVDRLTPQGKAFFNAMKQLDELEVRIGYQDGLKYPDGTPVIQVAMWNELGTIDIPARPFIRQTADSNQNSIANFASSKVNNLGAGETAESVLDKIGVYSKGLLQSEIKNGGFVPNAESTIKKKGSDHPLIDTALLRQSVNFVVSKKGSGE